MNDNETSNYGASNYGAETTAAEDNSNDDVIKQMTSSSNVHTLVNYDMRIKNIAISLFKSASPTSLAADDEATRPDIMYSVGVLSFLLSYSTNPPDISYSVGVLSLVFPFVTKSQSQ